MTKIKELDPLMSFLAGDPLPGIFSTPGPPPSSGPRTAVDNGQIVSVSIPKNQLQGVIYFDYVNGTEGAITIDVEYEDVNIPGEKFFELQKTSLSTHVMDILSRFRLEKSLKGFIPFPITYRHGTLRITVSGDADGDGELRLWFNDGALVDEPCPDVFVKERELGEVWELPHP